MSLSATHLVLLADLKDVIGALVPFVVLILWVLSQIGEANKAKGKQKPPPRRPPQPRPARPPRPAGADQARLDPMDTARHEVEEFLRQTGRGQEADRIAQRQRPAPPQDEPSIEVLTGNESITPAPRRPQPKAGPPRPAPRGRPAEPLVTKPPRVPLADKKEIRVGVRPLSERTAYGGDKLPQTGDKPEPQLHAKFDYDLTQLTAIHDARTASAYDERIAPAVAANQLAAMLSTPQGVQQAVILSEILNRPADRW